MGVEHGQVQHLALHPQGKDLVARTDLRGHLGQHILVGDEEVLAHGHLDAVLQMETVAHILDGGDVQVHEIRAQPPPEDLLCTQGLVQALRI